MTELDKSVVLITGAAGGFGRQMMRQFAAAGAKLIVHDLRASFVRIACEEEGIADDSILATVASDLSAGEGCNSLFFAVADAGLSPDILVNNAGIGVGGRLDQVPRDRWEQVLQVNLLSPIRLCELFLPQMIERRSGHIVNISSIAGWAGAKHMTSYTASKFGLRGFSESLQGDVEEFGIKVSTVYPWFSKTPILDSEHFGSDEKLEVPDDIVTDPADVVAAILSGVRKNHQHIFPDKTAKKIQFMKRHFPKLFDRITKRIEKKVLAQSESAEAS